ncbi:MAG: DUF481 domain-containing protein [Planctomycetales bacterium]|nr:DUF481 domain-containing protein [Planctomycetales bacterium]
MLRLRFLLSLVAVAAVGAVALGQDELSLLPPVDDVLGNRVPIAAPPPSTTAEEPEGIGPPAGVDEVVQEPWYAPDVFLDREIWEGSVEFGLNGTTGNTESTSFRTGADAKHKTACNTLAMNLTYARTYANGRETQHNAISTVRDDWDFCNSPWLMFVKQVTEYDEFKAYDMRLTANGGLGYYVFKNDAAKWTLRAGGGASHEVNGPNDAITAEAVFGSEIEAKLTARQKLESTFEYFPEVAEWNKYRMQSKLSWAIQLDEAAKLSLKISVIDRFDSTPEGRKPNDLDYSALLMWKL